MKFNISLRRKRPALNYEREKAYVLTPEMELYTAVVTTALSDKFYEGSVDRLERIRVLILMCDPLFVARLAVYAREVLHLRSIPLVLAVELARVHRGDNLVSRLTSRVIQRADEITEMLALYGQANKRQGRKQLNRLSKQVQYGLATAFNKFDEYQFAKYNRPAQVKLRDALFLVHPRAKDDLQQTLFNKIVEDRLETPYTWEVELSALGQLRYVSQEVRLSAFTEKWEELIFSKRLGYMAVLRNLRNILEADVCVEAIERVCAYIADPIAVAKSKQLPFRFLSAWREVKTVKHGYASRILEALEKAVQCSAANIAGYDENTSVIIAADVSGSMQKENVSGRECAVAKDDQSSIVQWPVKTGVADIYSVTVKYFYPNENVCKGKVQLIDANDKVLTEESVNFTLTRAGKWNQLTFNTGTMINAGNYTIKLVVENANGLAVSGIDIQ